MITCIIVEDEPASQEILQQYIAAYPLLELKAVCHSAFEAFDALIEYSVQLLFLDVNMPRLSGLDFYRSLSNPPGVIFTTAYPEFAVNGFEVNAIDYLVKPFPFERFSKAVRKAQEQMHIHTLQKPDDFILLQADKKMHKINYGDIQFLEAMGDYVRVWLSGRTLVVHFTLQKLLDMLPSRRFFRIHKSYVISLGKLDHIQGNVAVVGTSQLPIGQTYRKEFLERLQQER